MTPEESHAATHGLNVAEGLVRRLAYHGVDRVWGNWGTDAAPVIEAVDRATASSVPAPRLVTAAHEMAALSAAHGEALVGERVGVAFVHVTVGTANAATGILNAARQRVPLVVLAGRSPITERGPLGTRNRHVQWGQESFDQAGMVREYLKWDMELRVGDQVLEVVDRALAIAETSPAGPVYLSLPREVLCQPFGGDPETPVRLRHGRSRPGAADVQAAIEALSAASSPVIVTGRVGRDPSLVADLVAFAEELDAAVVEPALMQHVGFPASHRLHAGFGASSVISSADVVLVLDSDVPWGGDVPAPPVVIQAGPDPLHEAYSLRTHPVDIALRGDLSEVLADLRRALKGPVASSPARGNPSRAHRQAVPPTEPTTTCSSLEWVSSCVGRFAGERTVIVNEYDALPEYLHLDRPGSFLGSPPSGGLGWGLGAAVGVAVADRDREVVAVVGDGTFMFANPVASLLMASEVDVALIVVVCDNGGWAEVQRSVTELFPEGAAAAPGADDPAAFARPPAYDQIAMACGVAGVVVDRPGDLPAVLEEARTRRLAGTTTVVSVPCC